MIAPARVAAVLLAAGRSTRFGGADKLRASLDGVPLVERAASMLRAEAFAARILVSAPGQGAVEGFERVRNDRPQAGQSRSLALGVRAARRHGVSAILVALADMPFVTIGHLRALMAEYGERASLLASTDGRNPMPPALFGTDWFDALEQLEGDRGARTLLDGARLVRASAIELMDIDTPADLIAARRVVG